MNGVNKDAKSSYGAHRDAPETIGRGMHSTEPSFWDAVMWEFPALKLETMGYWPRKRRELAGKAL